jgi:hypothetical protein
MRAHKMTFVMVNNIVCLRGVLATAGTGPLTRSFQLDTLLRR